MSVQKFSNNASALLSAPIGASDTTLTVSAQRNIPFLNDGDYFLATLFNPSDSEHIEIVKVTNVSGTTWTIERAQENTEALSHGDGVLIELRLTAGFLESLSVTETIGLNVSASNIAAAGNTWEVTTSAVSYFPDISINQIGITWWDGSQMVSDGPNATFGKVAPSDLGVTVSASVIAIDELGNRSQAKLVQAVTENNLPPTGPITINTVSDVAVGDSAQVSFSGATDAEGDSITYEITDTGGLTFSKTTDISENELVTLTTPPDTELSSMTFKVVAKDSIGLSSSEYSKTIGIISAQIIGVKLVNTSIKGGGWAHIDTKGDPIDSPDTAWFDSHPVWGGIVDETIADQTMVKVPKFYYKRGTAQDGNPAWWISDQAVNGFSIFPAFDYYGEEVDQFWVAKYQCAVSGGKLLSLATGTPRVSATLTSFKTYAEAHNVDGVEGFRVMHYDMWLALCWLHLVEKANMDVQTTVYGGNTSTNQVYSANYTFVINAAYRGVTGLWGNINQGLEGLVMSASRFFYRGYDESQSYTDLGVAVNNSYRFPLTFKNLDHHLFYDTSTTSDTAATCADSHYYYGTTADTYAIFGGNFSASTKAGLYALMSFWNGSSNTTVGMRLARIIPNA